MMTTTARSCIALLLACIPIFGSRSMASQVSPSKITQAIMMNNGVFMIWLSGSVTSPAACNTQGRYTIDATTAAGQARMSALMSVFMGGKSIVVTGRGGCYEWSDSESIDYFYMYP